MSPKRDDDDFSRMPAESGYEPQGRAQTPVFYPEEPEMIPADQVDVTVNIRMSLKLKRAVERYAIENRMTKKEAVATLLTQALAANRTRNRV